MDLLIKAINISGTTHVIISKIDVLEKINVFKLFYNNKEISFTNMEEMKEFINKLLINKCEIVQNIQYSNNPYKINIIKHLN